MKIWITIMGCCLQLVLMGQRFSETVLWPLGIDSADQVREHFVYGLIQAGNGDILAFAEGRIQLGDERPHHIVLKRSRDKGKTWLPSQVIVRSTNEECFANPTPIKDRKTGKLFLFYALNIENNSSRVYYLVSSDHGGSWSEPTEVSHLFDADPLKRPFHLPGPGHGITLDNGRMVVQFWHRFGVKRPVADRKYGVSVIYSDDQGRSWKGGGYVLGEGSGFTANESRLVPLGGARLLIDARRSDSTRFTKREQAISADGGLTWSHPQFGAIEAFPQVDAGLTTAMHKGRRFVLCTRPLGPGRNDLVVSYSTDATKTWSAPKLLFKGPANYSDLIQLNDGSFLVLYGRGKPRYAAVARFDWNWLMQDKK